MKPLGFLEQETLHAAKDNDWARVRKLINSGVDKNVDFGGYTLLQIAARKHDCIGYEELLKMGCDVNFSAEHVLPVIYHVMQKRCPRCIPATLKRMSHNPSKWPGGLSFDENMIKYEYKLEPKIDYAKNRLIETKHPITNIIAEFFKAYSYDSQQGFKGPHELEIIKYIEDYKLKVIARMLKARIRPDFHGVKYEGDTPLLAALKRGYMRIAMYLISKGADTRELEKLRDPGSRELFRYRAWVSMAQSEIRSRWERRGRRKTGVVGRAREWISAWIMCGDKAREKMEKVNL